MAERRSILIIEDDEELAALIAEYFASRHFEVAVLHSGETAVETIVEQQPDLVILDLMLPVKDGIAICREARPGYPGAILMLTASNDSVDQILGLEIGADDYVNKPIDPRVLLARVNALIRRTAATNAPSAGEPTKSVIYEDLMINFSAREVTLRQQPLELSTPEFELLSFLIDNAGTVISRQDLFQHIKRLDYDGQNRFVDITVSQIRKKMGDDADRYLKTVRGQGYLFMIHEAK